MEAPLKDLPQEFILFQNYPNPFNLGTNINYVLSTESKVNLSIYNSLGQRVNELVNKVQGIGQYAVNFQAKDLSSGIYFYKLEAGHFTQVKKMMLMK